MTDPRKSLAELGVRASDDRIVGADGILRSKRDEERLDRIFASVFGGLHGSDALAYLKAITINSVNGPKVTDDELRHVEGQRYIVALIQRRIENGRGRPAATAATARKPARRRRR